MLQKAEHDKHAREREIRVGDAVFAQNFGRGQTWVPAVVTARTGPVSFEVKVVSSGLCWRRHQDQLRLRYCEATNISEPASVVPLLEQPVQVEVDPLEADEHSDGDGVQPREGASTSVTPVPPPVRRYPLRDRQPPQRYSS